jgi:hypothetical protein
MVAPRHHGWSSFVAEGPRTLTERGNPAHRLRVEYSRDVVLVHLSGEEGAGWTVLAVDRASRRWAVAQAARQIDAAREACERLAAGR